MQRSVSYQQELSLGFGWGHTGKRNPQLYSVIYEPGAYKQVFASIGELIGVPIDHLIIESKRRWTREMEEANYPAWVRKSMFFAAEHLTGDNFRGKTVGKLITAVAKPLTIKINEIARAMGLADITLGDRWERGEKYPHRESIIRNSYALPLSLGDNLGAIEGWEQRDMQNRYEEIGEDTYRITAFEGKHPVELNERLQAKRYPIKPGDTTYRCCPLCGVPEDIARLKWNYTEGTINDPGLGRRVVFDDPYSLEAVFEDLEAELGEEIQNAIIEGQRLYSRSVAGTPGQMEESRLKKMLALRGLGNLKRFEMEGKSLQVTIENTVLYPLMVGMLQASFESEKGVEDSRCEWSVEKNGDLNISFSV